MKNVIMTVTFAIITLLVFGTILSIHGRNVRSEELQNNLSSAVEETVENLMQEKNYKINSREEFLADFVETLAFSLHTDSDLSVRVLKADEEKGILSVEVVEKFRYINGKEGQVSCKKTVIFNQMRSDETKSHTVVFYLSKEDMLSGKNSYKKYEIAEGDPIIVPLSPSVSGKKFTGWKTANGQNLDPQAKINGPMTYFASFQ